MLHVRLHNCVIKPASNQSLGIEDCVCWVHGNLILGSISDEPLRIGKGHVAGSGPVALVVGNDLHFAMLEHTYTGVGGPEIDPDCWSLGHFCI